MDVIYLTYANSHKRYLPSLAEESDNNQRSLFPGALDQKYLLRNDPLISNKKISEFLIWCADRLIIFHFGGHAGMEFIAVNEKKVYAAGLAHQFGQCSKLQLVVLNGCSTRGQVEALLEAGVPVVIASHGTIEDNKAKEFSSLLYQGLGTGKSIEESFELAIGHIIGIDQSIKDLVGRGDVPLHGAPTDPVWGIFYRDSGKPSLKYMLPVEPVYAAPPKHSFQPNNQLVTALWQTLKTAIPEKKLGLIEDEDIPSQRMAIINNYPAPVGEKLRILMVPSGNPEGADKPSKARLEQMVLTYQILMDLLSFTLLAQIWEVALQKRTAGASLELSGKSRTCEKLFAPPAGRRNQCGGGGLWLRLH